MAAIKFKNGEGNEITLSEALKGAIGNEKTLSSFIEPKAMRIVSHLKPGYILRLWVDGDGHGSITQGLVSKKLQDQMGKSSAQTYAKIAFTIKRRNEDGTEKGFIDKFYLPINALFRQCYNGPKGEELYDSDDIEKSINQDLFVEASQNLHSEAALIEWFEDRYTKGVEIQRVIEPISGAVAPKVYIWKLL